MWTLVANWRHDQLHVYRCKAYYKVFQLNPLGYFDFSNIVYRFCISLLCLAKNCLVFVQLMKNLLEHLEGQVLSQAILTGSLSFLTFLLALLREGWIVMAFWAISYLWIQKSLIIVVFDGLIFIYLSLSFGLGNLELFMDFLDYYDLNLHFLEIDYVSIVHCFSWIFI